MKSDSSEIMISDAVRAFIDMIRTTRSVNTFRTYSNALHRFSEILTTKISIENTPINQLNVDSIVEFSNFLKHYSPASEKLYLTAIYRFFEYLSAEGFSSPSLPRLRLLIRNRSRRQGQRLPQFPKEHIELLVNNAINIDYSKFDNQAERLIGLRDTAFIITLADTGLRVHEICKLRRGDIDWREHRAIIIGKGDQEAIVRFSKRSLKTIKEYLDNRSALDGTSGRSLPSLPLFARHDRGAGKKIKPITTTTGRNIVTNFVRQTIGDNFTGLITPHSFRHYFVTTVLLGSGGNLKLAQELARHKNISVTQRYAHLSSDELDRGYKEIFE